MALTQSDRNMSHMEAVAAGLVTYHQDASVVPNPPTIIMTDELKKRLDEMKTSAVKADEGKADWSLVPFEALEGMVKVLEFGAKKYSRNNWQTNGGFEWLRVFSSTMRHMFAWVSGEDNDKESGFSHISHAQCNLLFLAHYIRNKDKFSKDNRNVR